MGWDASSASSDFHGLIAGLLHVPIMQGNATPPHADHISVKIWTHCSVVVSSVESASASRMFHCAISGDRIAPPYTRHPKLVQRRQSKIHPQPSGSALRDTWAHAATELLRHERATHVQSKNDTYPSVHRLAVHRVRVLADVSGSSASPDDFMANIRVQTGVGFSAGTAHRAAPGRRVHAWQSAWLRRRRRRAATAWTRWPTTARSDRTAAARLRASAGRRPPAGAAS